MDKGIFVAYNGRIAAVVRTGPECSGEAGGDLDDHLGIWFGDISSHGHPEIWTIPADVVESCEIESADFKH